MFLCVRPHGAYPYPRPHLSLTPNPHCVDVINAWPLSILNCNDMTTVELEVNSYDTLNYEQFQLISYITNWVSMFKSV